MDKIAKLDISEEDKQSLLADVEQLRASLVRVLVGVALLITKQPRSGVLD
jgi:hypothetical protein